MTSASRRAAPVAGDLRVMASARPGRIAMPARADVAALAKPEAFERWNAGVRSASAGDNVITMYDVIGEDWWTGGGVTVNRVDAALRKIGGQDVEVHINSPGGDMFEGIAIYNRLREHPASITVKVMGLAASAASIVAMAGDEILIGAASFLMIHDCWVLAMGNRHELAETSTWLEPFDSAMADVYASRSGLSKVEVAAMMDAETWMSGGQAVERGFATGLLDAEQIEEDAAVTEQARAFNAVRQTEIGLCKSMSRSEARGLIAKIKGTPGAAPDAKPDAGAPAWLGAAAQLAQSLRS